MPVWHVLSLCRLTGLLLLTCFQGQDNSDETHEVLREMHALGNSIEFGSAPIDKVQVWTLRPSPTSCHTSCFLGGMQSAGWRTMWPAARAQGSWVQYLPAIQLQCMRPSIVVHPFILFNTFCACS
jgi:hypothetical protein